MPNDLLAYAFIALMICGTYTALVGITYALNFVITTLIRTLVPAKHRGHPSNTEH